MLPIVVDSEMFRRLQLEKLLRLVKCSIFGADSFNNDLTWRIFDSGMRDVIFVLDKSLSENFFYLKHTTIFYAPRSSNNSNSIYAEILNLLQDIKPAIVELALQTCGVLRLEGLVLAGAQLTLMPKKVTRSLHTDPPKIAQVLLGLTMEGSAILTLQAVDKKIEQFKVDVSQGYMLVDEAVGNNPLYKHMVDKVCDTGRYSVLFRFCRQVNELEDVGPF